MRSYYTKFQAILKSGEVLDYIQTFLIEHPELVLIVGAIIFILVLCLWTLLVRLQKKGIWALVPFVRFSILFSALGLKSWLCLFMFIPGINLFMRVYFYVAVARKFDRSYAFVPFLVLLPLIFLPIVAFGDGKTQHVKIQKISEAEPAEKSEAVNAKPDAPTKQPSKKQLAKLKREAKAQAKAEKRAQKQGRKQAKKQARPETTAELTSQQPPAPEPKSTVATTAPARSVASRSSVQVQAPQPAVKKAPQATKTVATVRRATASPIAQTTRVVSSKTVTRPTARPASVMPVMKPSASTIARSREYERLLKQQSAAATLKKKW